MVAQEKELRGRGDLVISGTTYLGDGVDVDEKQRMIRQKLDLVVMLHTSYQRRVKENPLILANFGGEIL